MPDQPGPDPTQPAPSNLPDFEGAEAVVAKEADNDRRVTELAGRGIQLNVDVIRLTLMLQALATYLIGLGLTDLEAYVRRTVADSWSQTLDQVEEQVNVQLNRSRLLDGVSLDPSQFSAAARAAKFNPQFNPRSNGGLT